MTDTAFAFFERNVLNLEAASRVPMGNPDKIQTPRRFLVTEKNVIGSIQPIM